MTATQTTLLTVDSMITELSHFYSDVNYSKLSEGEIKKMFDEHVKQNSQQVTAGELVELDSEFILIDTRMDFNQLVIFTSKEKEKFIK